MEKADVDRMLAVGYAAEGKIDRAMKVLDDLERMAEREKLEQFWLFVPLWRAWRFVLSGEGGRALAHIDEFFRRLKSMPDAKISAPDARFEGTVVRILALARARRVREARTALERLTELAGKMQAAEKSRSWLSYANGEVALAEGDGNAAVRHFSRCWDEHTACRVELALTQKRLGALAAAKGTRDRILRTVYREMSYVLYRYRLLRAWGESP
jgi:hypothetical protein